MLPLLPLLVATSALVAPSSRVPPTIGMLRRRADCSPSAGAPLRGHAAVCRRAVLSSAAAAVLAGPFSGSIASAATREKNEAEEKLEALLAKKVKEKEAALGFQLEPEDILDVENILRNKYCGPQGAWSGEPGGTCAESPAAIPTCFKTGYSSSCIDSFKSK
jgi:hypothetical protein